MTNTNTEPLDASVTLEEIFAVVSQKRAPLAPELAGYLVLELAEGVGNAGEIDPRYVYVSEEGSVALVRGPNEAAGDAEGSLRRLLGKLLETAGAQTPALASVAKRKGGAGVSVLVEELEASLIPVNRSAGKRALARLARETKRVTNRVGRNASVPEIAPGAPAAIRFDEHEAVTAGGVDTKPPPPHPDESASNLPTVGISKDELDAVAHKAKRDSVDSLLDSFEVSGQKEDKALGRELKAMAGLEPSVDPPKAGRREPPTTTPPPVSASDADAIESLLAESAPAATSTKKATGRESPASRRSAPPKSEVRPPQPSYGQERQLPTAPSQVKKIPQLSLSNEAKQLRKTGGSSIGIILLFVLIIAGFAVALWLVKPGFLTGRTPEKIAAERAAAEAESARIAAQRAIPACHGTLVVSGAPKDSEVLIREGQAPVDVDHMPVGTRLEFVATAEGYAPKRAVVPEGAAWDSATGKPRFDLPVQLDKSKARAGAVDAWPPIEPGTEVGGKGNPGTVHVISSPKGAEIWVLAGIGPDATIEEFVGCDTDIDVLVAGPTTFRKRLHVPASSFAPDPSGKAGVRVAHLNVK
ncbi:MAG TPA: hypothetical protein VH054_11245 [Polyangiaceae bacterium]|jgi:hypothetical protein|nr:hypothetical protein [Polyangiaceae bacterium]